MGFGLTWLLRGFGVTIVLLIIVVSFAPDIEMRPDPDSPAGRRRLQRIHVELAQNWVVLVSYRLLDQTPDGLRSREPLDGLLSEVRRDRLWPRVSCLWADEWASTLRIEYQAESFSIRCFGPDGRFGTADDIVSDPLALP